MSAGTISGEGRGAGSALAGGWARFVAFIRRWDKDALERAEGEARRAERRLREAIEMLPQGVVFLDADGRYILWNQAYADIYRRSADQFAEGARLADTLRVGVARGDYPDAVGREEAWIAERLARMADPGQRHEQQLADGRWLLIEERRTGDGGVIGLRVDITEMKQQAAALQEALARAEAANRAKSEFLANMSHEIRTPLNGVIGVASVLAASELAPAQREMVEIIEGSARSLNTLLCDLLDEARIEAGRLELAVEPFRLAEVVREVATLFRHPAEQKGLSLRFDAAPEADRLVEGDPVRLRQVLTNLVANAVKFTETGGVTLRLAPDGVGWWRIEVADTGVGFTMAQKEALFARFVQADGSITRRFGGSGLGLSIARNLVELMGGEIDARAAPGQGATFTVRLPAPQADG